MSPHDDQTAQEYWEAHYGERERIWSGRVNAQLPGILAGVVPGRALDLGCGEGGDAVWLAENGWQVTAVDISETAIGRAAAAADARGVRDRIEFERHDLSDTFPEGTFDLISAQFLHSTVRLERPRFCATRPTPWPQGQARHRRPRRTAAVFKEGPARPPVPQPRRGTRRTRPAGRAVGAGPRRRRGARRDRPRRSAVHVARQRDGAAAPRLNRRRPLCVHRGKVRVAVTATAESGRCQPRPDSRSTVISADELAGRPRHPGSTGRSRKVRTSQSRVIANGNPR